MTTQPNNGKPDRAVLDELSAGWRESAELRNRVGIRVTTLEPRDWSNYIEPFGTGYDHCDNAVDSLKAVKHMLDFLRRCDAFLDRYTERLHEMRRPISERQQWRCYFGYDADPHSDAVLRTFGPVVHRGIECANRDTDAGCEDLEHHCVACLNHASALGGRTDDELRAAVEQDPVLARCYPIALLPSGHGWCGTGMEHPLWGQFSNPRFEPGGWGGIGDDGARGMYAFETALESVGRGDASPTEAD